MIRSGARVTLRNGSPADVARLTAIRGEPEIARRWGILEEGEIEEFVAEEKTFVIEVDGEVIGATQYGEEDDPMYRSASIDVYLTTPSHGQGLGSEAVRILARYLIEERGHHRLTIDPAADNAAAIRAYEKVGFRPVGVMRSYERGPDGTWHDGLLMELLADELIDESAQQGQPTTFHSAFPILSTRDVGRLLGFYEGLLGGEIRYRFPADAEPVFVTIGIGSSEFGIAVDEEAPEGRGGQRAAMWVYSDDADGAIERLRAAGVMIVDEAADQPWGERMGRVLDPDGNEVLIGSRSGTSQA